MRKIVPKESALHYLKLGQAVYKENCSDFLSKNIPEAELLEGCDVQKRKVILIKNNKTNELVIVFRGREDCSRTNKQELSAFSPSVNPTVHLEAIAERMSEWEKKHGKISVMLSHTDSSYLASKLAQKTLLITFNGYNVDKGYNRINLAIPGSVCNQSNFHPDNYTLLLPDNSDHSCFTSNKAIEKFLNGKSWEELHKVLAEQEAFEVSDVNLIENILAQTDPQDVFELLKNKFHSLLNRYDEYKAMFDKAVKNDQVPTDRLKKMAFDIYENQRHLNFREQEVNTLPPLPEIQRIIYFGIHPSGTVLDRMRESKKSLEDYDRMQQNLQTLLKERKARRSNIHSLREDFNQIDAEIHKRFKELSIFEKKAKNSLEVLEKTISFSSIIMSTQPMGKLFTTGISLLSWGNNIGKGIKTKRTLSLLKTQKENQRKSLAINAQLDCEDANIGHEFRTICSEIASLPNTLPAASNYTDPHLYKETLQKNEKQLKLQIEDSEESVKITQAACEEANTKIQQLAEEIERLNEQKKAVGKNNGPCANAWAAFGKEKADISQLEEIEREIQEKKEEKNKEEIKLYFLDKKRSSENSTLEELRESEENVSKLLERDNELAPLKEFFYESMRHIAERDKNLDEKIRNWRDTAERGLIDFNYARENERRLVEGTLSGFIDIMSEAEQFSSLMGYNGQSFAKMKMGMGVVQQVSKIRDLSISWYKTHETIKLTQDELIKENPNASYIDAIQALGYGVFIGHYVIPGLQIATSGIALLRMTTQLYKGNFSAKTREEIMFEELGKFLHALSSDIAQKVELFLAVNDANHHELLTTVNLARKELGIVHKEVLHEIEHSREKIIDKLDKTNDYNFKFRLSEKKNRIVKSFQEIKIESRPVEQVQLIRKFLTEIYTFLLNETTNPINCGMSGKADAEGKLDQLTTHLPLHLAAQNPVLYAPLIAQKLGYKEVSCPYLLFPLVECYSDIKTYVQNQIIDISDMENLCCAIELQIKEQLGKILPFLDQGYLEKAIVATRERQDFFIERIIKQEKKNSEFIEKISKLELQFFLKNKKEILDSLSRTGHLVGPKKFRYADIFLNQKFSSSYEQVGEVGYGEHVQKQLKRRNYVDYIPNAIGAGAGILAVGAGVATGINPIFGVLLFALGNTPTTCWDLYRYRQVHQELNKRTSTHKAFDEKSIIDLTRDYSNGFGDQLEGISSVRISAWLEKSGKLASYVEWCHEINSSTIQEKLSLDREPKNTPSFRLEIDVQPQKLTMESLGKIKLSEIEQLTNEHIVPENYLESILELCEDYKSWIENIAKNQVTPTENPFSNIASEATVLLSKKPELIPLAIPTKCIKHCYSLLKDEAYEISASGVGVLIPYYDFQENRATGAWELKLVFDFVERLNSKTRLPYAEFTLAEIDLDTAKAFTQPTFDLERSDQKPNLNELLLQALYTRLYPTLGMPGDKTASLGQGGWLASSERPFPGFFAIWEKEPTKSIHFKLSEYNASAQNELHLIVKGKTSGKNSASGFLGEIKAPHFTENYLTVLAKIREGKAALKDGMKSLEEGYQLLVAYCCFASSVDDHTLYSSIEEYLGILTPDSIFDHISAGSLPSKLRATKKERFRKILEVTTNRSLNVRKIHRLNRYL